MTGPPAGSGRPSGRVENTTENAEVNRTLDGVTGPEITALTPPPRRSTTPRTRRRLLGSLEADLSDRERAVLTSVATYRCLTTVQLQRLHFTDHQTEGAASRICRRVLQRLGELRVIEHLDRRVGGIRAGSASFVWRVGPVGDRLLRQAHDVDRPRARRKEPSLRYLDHCLAVAECAVQLVEAERTGALELLQVQPEPDCWRPYLGPHGAAETLKPDLAAVTASGDYEDHWFIELDRGTESLPTVLNKCAQYERYRRTGHEQRTHQVFPVVLWVVPDERRAVALAEGIRRARDLDNSLFRIVLTDHFRAAITAADNT